MVKGLGENTVIITVSRRHNFDSDRGLEWSETIPVKGRSERLYWEDVNKETQQERTKESFIRVREQKDNEETELER